MCCCCGKKPVEMPGAACHQSTCSVQAYLSQALQNAATPSTTSYTQHFYVRVQLVILLSDLATSKPLDVKGFRHHVTSKLGGIRVTWVDPPTHSSYRDEHLRVQHLDSQAYPCMAKRCQAKPQARLDHVIRSTGQPGG